MAYYRVGNGTDSGSGGGSSDPNIIVGEWSPTSDTDRLTVPLTRQDTPSFVALWCPNMDKVNYGQLTSIGVYRDGTSKKTSNYNTYNSSFADWSTYGGATISSSSVVFEARGGTYLFKAGMRYRYMIAYPENS